VTTPKCMVCTCEDVSDDEVLEAVALGYRDLESLKRYTGLATGPCQGKSCVTMTRRLVAEATGAPLEEVGAITFRPPVKPVPLRMLAGDDEEARGR
jgi:sarcosine oxidase subunit beta